MVNVVRINIDNQPKQKSRKPSKRILPGEVFTRLTAVRLIARQEGTRNVPSCWLCLCSCGTTKEVRSDKLRDGSTKSCGCLAKEMPDELRKTRLPDNYTEMTNVYVDYKLRAEKKGREFYLTREQVHGIVVQPCYYCGKPPSNTKKAGKHSVPFKYSGIDRRDNNVGYTLENVVPCCRECNTAKFTQKEEVFQEKKQNQSPHNPS